MKLIKLALFVALCLCCAGLAFGLPKKKNKNNNKVSNSDLEEQDDSDLIPIPDHLLDEYNKNSDSGKIQSEILNQVSMSMVGRLYLIELSVGCVLGL